MYHFSSAPYRTYQCQAPPNTNVCTPVPPPPRTLRLRRRGSLSESPRSASQRRCVSCVQCAMWRSPHRLCFLRLSLSKSLHRRPHVPPSITLYYYTRLARGRGHGHTTGWQMGMALGTSLGMWLLAAGTQAHGTIILDEHGYVALWRSYGHEMWAKCWHAYVWEGLAFITCTPGIGWPGGSDGLGGGQVWPRGHD